MRKLLLASAALLVTSLAASAQSGSHPSPAQPNPTNTPSSLGDSSTSDPNDPGKTWDKAFVKKMWESDQATTDLATLALQNSQNEDVKHFAQTTIDERKQFEEALDPIAKQLGTSKPADSHKEKKEIAKLKGLTGPSFDKEYMSLLTKQSQESVKDSNKEASNTNNAALKDVAQKNAKAITDRLQQIQTLSAKQ